MKSFDRQAAAYDAAAFIQRDQAAWLAEWLPDVRAGIALEVAAGPGIFTRQLFPWNGEIIATDASPAMVQQGQIVCPKARWKVCDARQLPELSADWILSSSFLQWMSEPEPLLRHWRTRLAPEGRVLAGIFVHPTLSELTSLASEHTPLNWRSDSDWIDLFEKTGYRVLRAEAQETVYRFPTGLELLRFLHRIGAAPERKIPGTGLRRLARAYDERFSDGQTVPSTWTFLRLEARNR